MALSLARVTNCIPNSSLEIILPHSFRADTLNVIYGGYTEYFLWRIRRVLFNPSVRREWLGIDAVAQRCHASSSRTEYLKRLQRASTIHEKQKTSYRTVNDGEYDILDSFSVSTGG